MIWFYFISLLMIFTVIPRNTYSLFTESVLNIINSTGSVTCYLTSANTNDDFHLCAIRVYTYSVNVDISQTTYVWDGIWFTNTFRQLIETRNCTGFDSASDIGSGTCDPMPYENAETMTLCICAMSNCNQNLEECQKSNVENPDTPPLPDIISDLTTVIECANTSSSDFTCFPSTENASFIDSSACEVYVNTYSVLCTIIDDGTNVLKQEALIVENYQSYLTNRLHLLQLLSKQMSIKTLDQTNTSIYVTYPDNDHTDQECGCTQNSFCNDNINTCAPNIIEIQTTNSVEFVSTSVTESVSTPMTDLTTVFTSILVADFTTESTTETSVTTAQYDTSSPLPTYYSIITDSITYCIPEVIDSASDSTGLSTGAIVGIVIGATVGGIIMISLAVYIFVSSGKFHTPFNRRNAYQV